MLSIRVLQSLFKLLQLTIILSVVLAVLMLVLGVLYAVTGTARLTRLGCKATSTIAVTSWSTTRALATSVGRTTTGGCTRFWCWYWAIETTDLVKR